METKTANVPDHEIDMHRNRYRRNVLIPIGHVVRDGWPEFTLQPECSQGTRREPGWFYYPPWSRQTEELRTVRSKVRLSFSLRSLPVPRRSGCSCVTRLEQAPMIARVSEVKLEPRCSCSSRGNGGVVIVLICFVYSAFDNNSRSV